MVFSQAFQAVILPAVAIPVFLLMNRSKLMNVHTANWKENTGVFAGNTFFSGNQLFRNY
jgi:manganese transport protein